MRHIEPRCSMCIPFRNWFVLTMSAIDRRPSLADDHGLLRHARQALAPVLRDDDEVLDPHTDVARQVDPGLDGDDVAHLENGAGLGPQVRLLVDVETDTVAETVAVALPQPGRLDRDARRGVDVPPDRAGADGRQTVELRRRQRS